MDDTYKNNKTIYSPLLHVSSNFEISAREQLPMSWSSPYYRLAARETDACREDTGETASLYACEIFQGIGFEIIRNCVLPRKSQLTFAEQNMPVCFSLRLAGTGSIGLCDIPVQLQAPRQLTVGYFPGRKGLVSFEPDTNTLVNILVRRSVIRKCMPQYASSIYRFLNLDEQEGYVLRSITASTGLMVVANQLLAPSASSNTQPLFLSGVCLQFLALAIDNLYKYLEHGHIIRLEKKDVAILEKVKKYLEHNIANTPSIDELCKKFYINSFKLKKGFKQIYGMTISGYIQYYRLYYAYNCFIKGDTNVSECAWKVGYTNVSHFIAAFRRQFGFTPGECIRNHKECQSSRQHMDTGPDQTGQH